MQGEVEFRSVLYIPGMGPLNNEEVINPKTKNIRLYVKRVFISDDFDGELVSILTRKFMSFVVLINNELLTFLFLCVECFTFNDIIRSV